MAYSLHYEIATVQSIKIDSSSSEEACLSLLEDWLTSSRGVSPKTWAILIERIEEVDNLYTAATEIRKELETKFT